MTHISKISLLPMTREISLHFHSSVVLPPESIKVRSSSGGSHLVSLLNQTCTCNYFDPSRARNYPNRLCFHLCRQLTKINAFRGNDIIEAIVRSGNTNITKAWVHTKGDGTELYITGAEDEAWLHVYGRNKSGILLDRGSYNIDEHRWAYGMGFPGSSALTVLLKAL